MEVISCRLPASGLGAPPWRAELVSSGGPFRGRIAEIDANRAKALSANHVGLLPRANGFVRTEGVLRGAPFTSVNANAACRVCGVRSAAKIARVSLLDDHGGHPTFV